MKLPYFEDENGNCWEWSSKQGIWMIATTRLFEIAQRTMLESQIGWVCVLALKLLRRPAGVPMTHRSNSLFSAPGRSLPCPRRFGESKQPNRPPRSKAALASIPAL